ncbi:hypothetical protein MRB53_040859 [Persea americana]|nr:hypothetical protein MRB53_040859 [Persea americana]
MSFAYWNTNIPEEKHTKECPEGLRNLDADDTAQLSMRDEDYKLMSWQEVKKIISEIACNTLPLSLTTALRREPIGRLQANAFRFEKDTKAKGRPFEDPSDLKIIGNDWPYGIDRDITHICVWTKFTYEEDPRTGDLTDRARALIDGYVDRTFRSEMKADDVRDPTSR